MQSRRFIVGSSEKLLPAQPALANLLLPWSENDLLNTETNPKLRRSFAIQFANELWQADTMYSPSIKQPDDQWRKTFLIAFIDDASRVITHGGVLLPG